MFDRFQRSISAVLAVAASVIGRSALADRMRPDIPWREIPRVKPLKPKVRNRGSTFGGRYGQKRYAREMARRIRQIERGQLTASNGLVSERTGGLKVNSHGNIHTLCKPCARHFEGQDCDFPNCADVRANGCAA